jgi:hypothetical protein
VRAASFALVGFALVCSVVNAAHIGVVYFILALLCASVGMALLASGHRSHAAVAAGSMGALLAAFCMRFQLGYAATGLVLGMAIYAERTYRVRGDSLRGLHLAAAGLAGALAMHLAREFVGSDWQLPAAGLATALLALPFALSAEDAWARTLHDRALLLSGEARSACLEVAELRRRAVTLKLDAKTHSETDAAFAFALAVSELMLNSALRQNGKNSEEIADMLQVKMAALVTNLSTALHAAELAHVQQTLGVQPAKSLVSAVSAAAEAPTATASADPKWPAGADTEASEQQPGEPAATEPLIQLDAARQL